MEHYDILIIGGGAAGISAARAASGKVLLADRRPALGGILLQCAHRGFGGDRTGPEYAAKLAENLPPNVRVALNTTVLEVTKEREALLSGPETGRKRVRFSRLVLAAGCREIPPGALDMGGTRPEGVYTAGQMQEMMNLHGVVPEGPAVILGSGDLGLIMARQMAALGIGVTMVERKAACGGMAKNQQCLKEFPIRLICGDTIARLHGDRRLLGCTTERGEYLPCATLLVAAGLLPERTLVHGLGDPEWLRLCGNCHMVHPMVERVVKEGTEAGLWAGNQRGGSL